MYTSFNIHLGFYCNAKELVDEVEKLYKWEDGEYDVRDLYEVGGGKEFASEDLQRVAKKLKNVLQ